MSKEPIMKGSLSVHQSIKATQTLSLILKRKLKSDSRPMPRPFSQMHSSSKKGCAYKSYWLSKKINLRKEMHSLSRGTQMSESSWRRSSEPYSIARLKIKRKINIYVEWWTMTVSQAIKLRPFSQSSHVYTSIKWHRTSSCQKVSTSAERWKSRLSSLRWSPYTICFMSHPVRKDFHYRRRLRCSSSWPKC